MGPLIQSAVPLRCRERSVNAQALLQGFSLNQTTVQAAEAISFLGEGAEIIAVLRSEFASDWEVVSLSVLFYLLNKQNRINFCCFVK